MDDNEGNLTEKKNENKAAAYSKPEVTVLGKLEDLTQNLGTKGTDGISGSRVI